MMKKIVCLLLGAALLTGCQNGATKSNGETTEPETVVVEVEKVVEKEVIKEVAEYQSVDITNPTITMPEKSESSWIATVKGEYSDVVYIGHEKKLTTTSDNPNWSTSTPDLISITKDGYAIAKKQGLATVNDGTQTITIACTNYADGRDPLSFETDIYENGFWDGGQYSYELWQSEINTVTDYLRYIYEQGYQYGEISSQCTEKWVGFGDPRTVLEARRGVCAEAAALACGLLQYDYEEVGTINVSAYGYGHAYSYVYEDGYYYVFDATSLFSQMTMYTDAMIKKFATIDEVKAFVLDYYNGFIADKENENAEKTCIAIYMVNSKHVGCAAPTYSSFHNGGQYEAFTLGYAFNGVEEGFEATVLWSNPNINFEMKYIPSRQVQEDGCRTFFLYQ